MNEVAQRGADVSPTAGRAGRPKALVIAYCFPPHGAIGTHRTLRLVQCLDAEGWDVDVVTPSSTAYAPGTPVDDAFVTRVPASTHTFHTGVWRPFEKLSEWLSRGKAPDAAPPGGVAAKAGSQDAPVARPGLVKRIRQGLSAATSIPDQEIGWMIPAVWNAVTRSRPDVVYSSGPPYTGHLAALVASRALRRPWVADFRDPWSRAPWRTEHQSGPVRAAHGWLEARVVHAATAVVFTTEGARQEFTGHYGHRVAARFRTIRNGCDPSLFPPRRDAGEACLFTLLHAGSLYGGRDPRPLVRAVAAAVRSGEIDPARFRIVFLGRVDLEGVDLAQEAAAAGIPSVVQLMPRAVHAESVRMMQDASALLLLQPGTKLSVPGKLYEYFAAGRPILAIADDSETADMVRQTATGIVVAPGDEQAIRDAVVRLYRGADAFAPADPAVFDGARRAAEMESLLRAVARPRGSASARIAAAPGGSAEV